jgi:hypothetical protein
VDSLGKLMVGIGTVIVLIGALVLIANRLGIHLGKLPGDIVIRKDHVTLYFPIVTSIIISIILSLIFYLFKK